MERNTDAECWNFMVKIGYAYIVMENFILALQGCTGRALFSLEDEVVFVACLGPYVCSYMMTVYDVLQRGCYENTIVIGNRNQAVEKISLIFGYFSLYVSLQWKAVFLASEMVRFLLIQYASKKERYTHGDIKQTGT
ncbi:MAG: hypothetical protein HFE73_08125 [Firmicutes bacterium]|nr:hypothetical protein [Bacillota bacterium]